MRGIKIVFQKEMKRVFKDKKMIFSLFILPVILMVGLYGLMGYLAEQMVQVFSSISLLYGFKMNRKI